MTFKTSEKPPVRVTGGFFASGVIPQLDVASNSIQTLMCRNKNAFPLAVAQPG